MLDAQIPSGQGGGVVLIQDGTDQSSVFFFPGDKNDIFYAWEREVTPPTEDIHEACYWEMNHFPIRKCNRTEVS